MMKKHNLITSILLVVIILLIGVVSATEPSGASLTHIKNETAPIANPSSQAAIAGNISEIDVSSTVTTESWQGYFGNVSGAIQLADGSSNVMYNWSLASPSGEIYASTNNSITWTYIQCFNFSADGTHADDTAQAGGTSLHGTNVTQLESMFNIDDTDSDGVNETFYLIGAGTHDQFYTANKEFSEGECQNTRIYDSTGAGVNDHFEEVLLYEPNTRSIIFASILNKDVSGFDSASHDFEMLVLEDGHGTDTSTTTYYFWVELE